jgi:hypothetical protein
MAFDPDKYLSSKGGFDPDAYLAEKAPPVDMGPEARRASRLGGMRPSAKADEVSAEDVQGDYGKRDLNKIIQGRRSSITTPEDSAAEKARHNAEDPIQNDPLAAMIVQGIPAAGAGAFVGGATGVPILGQAAQGAAMDPEHPLLGAALGAIPGVPGAIGQADRAIGRLALDAPSLVPAGRAAGAAAGTYFGHKAGGFVGAGVGAGVGAKAGGAIGRAADRGVEALADRHLARTAQFPRPTTYEPPASSPVSTRPSGPIVDAEIVHAPEAAAARRALGPVSRLAPLVPEPIPESRMPEGFGRTRGPKLDEITGEPLTNAGKPSTTQTNHATNGAGTAVIPKGEKIGDLRSDVARDAKEFANAPTDVAEPPIDDVGAKLAKSVEILGKLKSAKAAGTLTDKMVQDALDAGMPASAVEKAAGTANPILNSFKTNKARDARNSKILSGQR